MTDLKGMRHPGSKLQIRLVFCSFSFIKKKSLSRAKHRFTQENGMEAIAMESMWMGEEQWAVTYKSMTRKAPRGWGFFLEQLKRRFQCDKPMLSLDI